jgi:hypothetical protein
MLTIWVSKEAEFYVDFKKYKLTYKMHQKNVFLKNMLNWDLFRKSPNLACF